MRSVFFAALLLPAAASVAHAQQAQPITAATAITVSSPQSLIANPTPAPSLRPVEVPLGITRAQARSNVTNASAVPVDNNTRNTLAIVGAVVIVIALVAFLL